MVRIHFDITLVLSRISDNKKNTHSVYLLDSIKCDQFVINLSCVRKCQSDTKLKLNCYKFWAYSYKANFHPIESYQCGNVEEIGHDRSALHLCKKNEQTAE